MDVEEAIKRIKELQPKLEQLLDDYVATDGSRRIVDTAYSAIDATFHPKDEIYHNRGWKTYFDQIAIRRRNAYIKGLGK